MTLTTPSQVRIAAAAILAAGLALSARRAVAGSTNVSKCSSVIVRGRSVLTRDLDCTSVYPSTGVLIDHGTLFLNGHTLITSGTTAVDCIGNCRIVGPGTITGDGNGVYGRKSVSIRDVDFSVTVGAIAAFNAKGTGKVKLSNVTITGGIGGVYTDGAARIEDSTIAIAGGVGVSSGTTDATGCITKGTVLLRSSSVTGSTAGCGPDVACADIASCSAPNIQDGSTCETSCQLGGSGPTCTPWGVCSAD